MRSRSPPGSTTAARFVVSHQRTAPFCWKRVTGTMTARMGMGPEGFGGGAGLLPGPPPMTMHGWSGRVGRPEVAGGAVHAVAQPRRLRAIIEDVAEKAAATRAMPLGAGNEQRVVGRGLD